MDDQQTNSTDGFSQPQTSQQPGPQPPVLDPQQNQPPAPSSQPPEPEHHSKAKLVLVLLLVLLLGIIGVLSYLLLQENEESENTQENTTEIVEETIEPATEEVEESTISEKWVTASTKDFTVKLPDGWVFQRQDFELLIKSCADLDCYNVNDGVPATVEEVSGGRGGGAGLIVALQRDLELENIVEGYETIEKLDNNFTVYKTTFEEELEAPNLPAGTMQYQILRQENDNLISTFTYTVLPEQEDPKETIYGMVDTYTLLNSNDL